MFSVFFDIFFDISIQIQTSCDFQENIYLTVTVFWAVSIVVGTTYLGNPRIIKWYSYITILLCLVTSIFSYTKIFLTLHHNQIQVRNHVSQGQPNKAIPLNIARCRKAVSNALWVQVTLVACYLPHDIALALTAPKGLPWSAIYAYFILFKLVIKPVALLL